MAGTAPRNLHGSPFSTKACADEAMQRPLLPLASTSLAAQRFSFAPAPVGAADPFSQTSAHKGLD